MVCEGRHPLHGVRRVDGGRQRHIAALCCRDGPHMTNNQNVRLLFCRRRNHCPDPPDHGVCYDTALTDSVVATGEVRKSETGCSMGTGLAIP